MEVLAPAGSKEAFKAALEGGADAVYLGGKFFGARRFAQNFSDQELKGAVQLAHEKEAKVYVTVNTLIRDRELPLGTGHLDFLDHIKVDAVIVQDRGLGPARSRRTSGSPSTPRPRWGFTPRRTPSGPSAWAWSGSSCPAS